MSELRDIAEFRSTHFSPVLPEDSQVNPQVYGAELSFWLCTELAKHGVVTSYPNAEDWGWFIEYFPGSGSEFAVHCCNVEGENDHWLLSLRRYGRKIFGRDKPPYEEAGPLIDGIKRVLNGDGISDVKWLYDTHAA